MKIYPFDKTFGDVITSEDVNSIEASGITVRSGNRLLRLSVVEESIVTDDIESIKQELAEKYMEKFRGLEKQFNEYKESMRHAVNVEKDKLEKERRRLEKQSSEVSTLPNLTEEQMDMGISVSVGNDGRSLVWDYKTVYAPKFVNGRQIEPSFAKRLITPIVIRIKTNGNRKVTELKVKTILGNNKFWHYHSFHSSDCWGDFKYSGMEADTTEKVIEICKQASFILQTINEFSLGKRNPKGLSRFDTIKKHLLDKNEREESTNVTNKSFLRSGVADNTSNDFEDNVWST